MTPSLEYSQSAYLARVFRDVDADSDLGKVLACLRFMEGLPAFNAYKRRSIEMLHLNDGEAALDIGCGLGFDVARLGAVVGPDGRAIGLDSSEKLLTAAKQAFDDQRALEWILGDGTDLPLPENSLDGIRVDRTLQHVEHPQRVIEQMHRVLRPNRWAVCAEPDWGTFVLDVEPSGAADLVVQQWSEGFRNPHMGRQLLRRLRDAGFQNTWVEGFILVADGLQAINMVYDLHQTVKRVSADDNGTDVDGWYQGLRARNEQSGVVGSVTLFLAGGQKAQ
jgi:SAM-dependent methyltransferase